MTEPAKVEAKPEVVHGYVIVRRPIDSPYGHGPFCPRCGGTATGDSHRGYVGRCNCGALS